MLPAPPAAPRSTALDLLSRLFGPWVRSVRPATLRADVQAGLLGALLVLPQGIAFASLAGLPPQYGLYSAIVPTLVAALAGSSWHVVSGPTNANSLALAAMLAPLAATGSPHYIELAFTITVMVGLIQAGVGVLRLGQLANFISPAALLGFTSGAACLIALHALRELLDAGQPAGLGPGGILHHTATHLDRINPAALLAGLLALGGAVVLRRFWPASPFMLLGLLAASVAGVVLPPGWTLHTLGALPSPWPVPHLPQADWASVTGLFDKALALSIVALGQSVSIAKAMAERSGQRVDTNREFLGQGLSNIAGGFSSCYLSCGSLNRSLPNLEAGARTPLAAVAAALWLPVLVAVSAPLLARIPHAAIAGLLVLVAWGLIDRARWVQLARLDRTDFLIALTTLAATLLLRLESAILLGTGLSLVAYLYRTSRPAMRVMGFDRHDPDRRFVVRADTAAALPECPQLVLLRMEGSIYFGAAAHVREQLHWLRETHPDSHHLLVMAKSMNFLDLAGAEVWESELRERRARGGDLYFHRPRPQVLALWERSGFLARLGPDHVFPDKRIALRSIHRRLDRGRCARCEVRVFQECREDDPGAAI
ncbi:SulP family sulfate permease [Sphaerotilus hippei]|uniref:SulP family sulfate permease n=1 Tax=Sphaerotilus hippei TaxID=744406 RepID=A0A318GWG2_9BURK|nr:SulP family inorganic anion transporter [Sphaerotilus hippei]PXW94021.1 SulP family sulfate permease [Sphaerotilus hippei]